MSLAKFWKKLLMPLEKHVKDHPNDLVAKNALQEYKSNIHLKKYFSGE